MLASKVTPVAVVLSVVAFTSVLSGPVTSIQGDKASCTFRAAVLEHVQEPIAETVLETMKRNIQVFQVKAEEAAAQGAALLVLPEYGVTGIGSHLAFEPMKNYLQISPNISVAWNPCEQNSTADNTTILVDLSCIARKHSIYVVANLGTLEPCEPGVGECGAQAFFAYNTDIIFDPNGTVIARYHKQNLYNEYIFVPPPQVEYSYIDTDFGRLGLITCFDLIWYDPMVVLMEEYNVDTILFPTAWQDQLPFLASVQAQESRAVRHRVNLIAANIFKPESGFVGSGLYSGASGAVNYTYDPENGGRLLVADLPCYPKEAFAAKMKDLERYGPVKKSTATANAGNTIKTNQKLATHDFLSKYPEQKSEAARREHARYETIEKYNEDELWLPQVPDNMKTKRHFKDGTVHYIKYEDLSKYKTARLNASQSTVGACYDDKVCCQLNYRLSGDMPALGGYSLLIYAGNISEDDIYTMQCEVCAVAWCESDDPVSCARVPETTEIQYPQFEQLELVGNFSTEYIYPSMLTTNVDIIIAANWDAVTANRTTGDTTPCRDYFGDGPVDVPSYCSSLQTKDALPQPLLVAALYGRTYSKDCWPCSR